jgi:hypothetical protein
MIVSGKTTIFNFFRNENETTATSKRKLEEVECKVDEERTIIIKKGEDIGGGDEYVRHYETMLLDSKYDLYVMFLNT